MLYVGDNHGCYEKEQVIHRKCLGQHLQGIRLHPYLIRF